MSSDVASERTSPGWLPFAMLAYLAFLFVPPALEGASLLRWIATAGGVLACAGLYLAAFVVRGLPRHLIVPAIVAIGLAYVPTNSAALVFFIYAGLLIPHLVPAPGAWGALVALVAIILAQAFWLALPLQYWFTAALCSAVAGVVNVNVVRRIHADAKLRRAREEVEQLAKIAERERIARDLHDVLGHTLSLIVLKSELAAKLADRDVERAKDEMRDVERTARDALAEIREAIRGYRAEGLASELDRARRTLETAGVAFDCTADARALEPSVENVLALVLREAVTNVVRHAGASACRIGLECSGDDVRLEVADNGNGPRGAEGNGVRGMRERVEAIGGTLRLEGGAGTRLFVVLPFSGGRS